MTSAPESPAHVGAPPPVDERQRLAAVHALALLDTPQEERFDRITRTAQRVLGVPMALIALVDAERQWFKSCQGLDVVQTDRSAWFCAYAVHADDPFLVPDARADERFAANPLVTGPPFIRAYLGIALHEAGGYRIGTLCVLDDQPREFSPDDASALADLARWAEAELNRTTLAEAVDAQRASAESLRAVLRAVPEGVATFDPHGRILTVNPAGERMYGCAAGELVGRDVGALIVDDREGVHEGVFARLATLQPGDEPVRTELIGRRADGVALPLEVTIGRIGVGDAGYVVAARDLTDRREVDRLKDEFVSVVSHELRTPLTSIRGSLGLLASGALGPLSTDAQRMADIAVSNTDRLVRLVNDILDLERIESGQVELQRSSSPVRRLVDDAVASVAGMAERKRVDILVVEAHGLVWVDADRIVQALANLLSNAVKFSEPGQVVEVRATLAGELLEVHVADQGRGIPVGSQARIFDRFQQVDASDARERAGTGLGLAIVKSIVEQHGGSVSVASAPERGSTFTIAIPCDVEQPDPAGRDRPERDRPLVLVVEDDADLAEVLHARLARRGVDVSRADGQSVAVAEAGRMRPDLIVLDLSLAEGDGYGVVEELRRDRGLASTPLLVYTVRDLDAHERRRLLLGPTEFLTKTSGHPADIERRVLGLVGREDATQPDRRVLMIDDDPDLRSVAVIALGQVGSYTVLLAASGEEGVRVAREHRPDVILLDVMMPELDGPATLVRLRSDPATSSIPVVFLTAKAQAAERERLAGMHVAGILSKPFDPMTLAADLARLMGWR